MSEQFQSLKQVIPHCRNSSKNKTKYTTLSEQFHNPIEKT